MRAAAFVRYSGAMGAGHVGWSFDFDADNVNSGSVENPLGTPSCDPPDMGYWNVFCYDPIPEMAERQYDALRYIDITGGNPAAAYQTAMWIAQQPYSVVGRNCLGDVYDVLRAYGVENMPPPSHDWLPNEWFSLWTQSVFSAVNAFVWRPPSAPSLAFLPVKDQVVPNLLAAIPVWRQPGTPQWHGLQAELAGVSGSASVRQHVGQTS